MVDSDAGEPLGLSVLIVDDHLHVESARGRATRALSQALRALGLRVLEASSADDGAAAFTAEPGVDALVVEWDLGAPRPGEHRQVERLLSFIRGRNADVPVFLLAERTALDAVPLDTLRGVNDYIWNLEDTPDFIAGRIVAAMRRYAEQLLPPMFGALVRFAEVHEYSWHTPGHAGGTAFLKSPAGREFFRFFGEALLRSDLSISVPELGSLLDHSGAIGAAERYAARVFGADRTYFVTNGTSTSNKVVFFATVGDGDMVLVDRNCHKSIEHAITMTRAQPVYLVPTRNRYGLIGPIPPARLRAGASGPAGTAMPAAAASARPALAVVTNSTYDGLCYDAQRVADRLGESVDRILFDEAWFGHARFHPLYRGRFGMGVNGGAAGPTVFATQSTHKLLAALSQASLVHVRSGRAPVEHRRLNEAFMMHTSTSPLYTIIAANDVCSRMMDGPAGRVMIHDALQEAVAFRRAMVRLGAEIAAEGGPDWWFHPWQPWTVYDPARGSQVAFQEAGDDVLLKRPESWTLEPGAAWHGFAEQDEGYCLLDPTKVTLLTPGVAEDGSMAEVGIPAPVVSRFLDSRGIVPEKTGDYTILFLFSLGITKGKWGTLVTALLEFKRLFDQNAPLRDVLPSLVALAPAKYGAMGLRDLCREMHGVMRARRLPERLDAAFSALPARALTPAEAYGRLVRGTVDALPLAEAANRVSAVGIVPYPPGIPLLMPGETTGEAGGPALAYLAALEEFDRDFPGFEHEIHGIEAVDGRYRFYCVRAT